MRIISTVLMAALFFSAPSQAAADLYLKKKTPETQTEQAQTPPSAPAPPAAAPTQQAEGMNDFANRYYKNCAAQRHPVLSGPDLELFCACSAANIADKMTMEDVNVMKTNTKQGQAIRNYMTVNVYAPCIEFPTRALITKSCMSDPQVASLVPEPADVCSCLAKEMGTYIAQNAKTVISRSLQENPSSTDPMGIFLASEEYRKSSEAYLGVCVQRHLLP